MIIVVIIFIFLVGLGSILLDLLFGLVLRFLLFWLLLVDDGSLLSLDASEESAAVFLVRILVAALFVVELLSFDGGRASRAANTSVQW